jgi:DNA modification methylase
MQTVRKSLVRPMAVVSRPIATLKFNPKNPRQHSQRQIRQIAESVKTFGFNVPVLIDPTLTIIAGHGRTLAAQTLGFTEVPTLCLDHLSEAQLRAFIIADNRLTENSRWDDKLLAEQLRELSALSLDFSLDVVGFEPTEIDLRIEGLGNPQSNDDAFVDAPSKSGPQISCPGDLWKLGRHKVICANALDAGAFVRLMGNERARMVSTDPPYNVPIDGHVSGLGTQRHREFAMAAGEMNSHQFADFLTNVFSHLCHNSVDGSIHFVSMDWAHSREILIAGHQSYSELKNICVWNKHNAGMGSLYRSQHEFVFVFKSGKRRHINNIQLGRNGRYRTNVWSYPGANNFGRPTEEGDLLRDHPTVKPVRLVADCMLDCSLRGDLVLDPFLGSGTSLIAAEQTGRRCFGMEVDPVYVDLTIRRWQAYSGETAIHAESEQPFGPLPRGKRKLHGKKNQKLRRRL